MELRSGKKIKATKSLNKTNTKKNKLYVSTIMKNSNIQNKENKKAVYKNINELNEKVSKNKILIINRFHPKYFTEIKITSY